MAKYALDTNILIDASRSDVERTALATFLRQRLPICHMSAIVGMELLAGVPSQAAARAVEEEFLAPFQRRDRLFGPTPEAILQAGRVLGKTRIPGDAPSHRSLVNDILIAVSCRERGIVLLTRDRDFHRILKLIPGLRVEAPYPEAVR